MILPRLETPTEPVSRHASPRGARQPSRRASPGSATSASSPTKAASSSAVRGDGPVKTGRSCSSPPMTLLSVDIMIRFAWVVDRIHGSGYGPRHESGNAPDEERQPRKPQDDKAV